MIALILLWTVGLAGFVLTCRWLWVDVIRPWCDGTSGPFEEFE